MCEMALQRITVPKVTVAENLVAGVQYLSKRDILTDISTADSQIALSCKEARYLDYPIEWIKIGQVGVCREFSCHQYYSAIQKALFSCHNPETFQIIFMVRGDGEKNSLYLGVRQLEMNGNYGEIFTESLSSFISKLLPGTKAEYCGSVNDAVEEIKADVKGKRLRHLSAFTGIPSFLGKDGEESISAIDTLIGPLSSKKFVYYVVADPLDENAANRIMTKCIEMAGKLESIKTTNLTETYNASTTIGESDGFSNSVTENQSIAVNRKGKKHHFWSKIMCTIGLHDFIDQSTKTISQGNTTGSSHNESRSDTLGNSASISMTMVNKNAEHAAAIMNKHASRFEKGLGTGLWETGVYLLTEDAYVCQSAAMQLKAVVSGKDTSLEPIRIHNLSSLMNQRDNESATSIKTAVADLCAPNIQLVADSGEIIKNNFEEKVESLSTYLTTDELSCLINLPQRSVPGISVIDYSTNFSLTPQRIKEDTKTLDIGHLVYSGTTSNIDVQLPIDTLSRHALVCGVNGSGKTNTVLSVLDGFMKADRPFFVIEPAKTEYVDWAIEYNKTINDPKKKIKIFIPGCERYSKGGIMPDKLQLNPFEVINLPNSEMRVISHIDRLKATFASAFPMQDILPVIMEHLLYKLYKDSLQMLDTGDKATYMKKGFPTLETVNAPFITDLMDDIGYAKENTQNISAALRTRFKSLKYGWKKELLNNVKLSGKTWNKDSKEWENSELTWEELFGSPVVVNLSYAGDDQDRAFIMSLLLQFLYEYRIAESETGKVDFNSNKCRHLVVVEEAHRVMANCLNPELPQYKSGQMFSNFLSEVRAYGQGMMVVDQVPTRLIEDAIKNTNVKIIHKLVASDDSQRIAECIGLTPEQQKVIAKLSIGQAVLAGFNSANVGSSDSSDIYLAQINKMK